MSRAKPHFLKTRNVQFPTKVKFIEHLQGIYHRAKLNKNGLVAPNDDVLDLKDFVQDCCDKSARLQETFDLDNCHFIVKKSPNYDTECLFIVDSLNNKEEQISFNRFGNSPEPIVNFRSFCTYTIMEFKKDYRIKLSKEVGKPYDEYDLWHKKPTTKEIVDEFIAIKELSDKLDEIISLNGLGNNVPYLLPDYEHLKQEFIDFYQSKVATQLNFELKPRN